MQALLQACLLPFLKQRWGESPYVQGYTEVLFSEGLKLSASDKYQKSANLVKQQLALTMTSHLVVPPGTQKEENTKEMRGKQSNQ